MIFQLAKYLESDACHTFVARSRPNEANQGRDRNDGNSQTSGRDHQQIAQRLGISEGAVRYHLKRQATLANATRDGRSKQSLIEKLGLVQVLESTETHRSSMMLNVKKCECLRRMFTECSTKRASPGAYLEVKLKCCIGR